MPRPSFHDWHRAGSRHPAVLATQGGPQRGRAVKQCFAMRRSLTSWLVAIPASRCGSVSVFRVWRRSTIHTQTIPAASPPSSAVLTSQ